MISVSIGLKGITLKGFYCHYKVSQVCTDFLIVLELYLHYLNLLYNKRVCPTKNEPQQGISYTEREKEEVWEREKGQWAGQQAGIFKVRFGRDREDRGKRKRDIEAKKQIDRAGNKNPEQSRETQLVYHQFGITMSGGFWFINVLLKKVKS